MSIILSALNARYSHASLGLRYLMAHMGELAAMTQLQEFVIGVRAADVVEKLLAECSGCYELGGSGRQVTLSVGNSRSLLEGLRETRIDVAVLAEAPGDPRLHVVPLRRDPVQLLVPHGHPLTRRRAVTLAEIADERLILREPGSITRRLVQGGFEEAGLSLSRVLEIESREAVVEAVAAGLGLGFMFVIAAELMGASEGLGFLLLDGQQMGRADSILVAMIVFALLGKLADVATRLLEHWALAWHPAYVRVKESS